MRKAPVSSARLRPRWGLAFLAALGGCDAVLGMHEPSLDSLPPPHLERSADFNADGRADVLLYDRTTGELREWYLAGAAVVGASLVDWSSPPSRGWIPVLTADFDYDGQTDVLWYNGATGEIGPWYLSGSRIKDYAVIDKVSPAWLGWKPVATADYNGDGRTDVLWYNAATGELSAWYLAGTSVIGSALVDRVADDPAWVPIGSQDFDLDGQPDLLWSKPSTGEAEVWFLHGVAVGGSAMLNLVDDTTRGLALVATDDYNGDAMPDALFYGSATGSFALAYLNGTIHTGSAPLNLGTWASSDLVPVPVRTGGN
jgi:hypothetical protein